MIDISYINYIQTYLTYITYNTFKEILIMVNYYVIYHNTV